MPDRSLHKFTAPPQRHAPFSFLFANAADREAGLDLDGNAIVFTADDVTECKVAIQIDNRSEWIITNHSPLAWEARNSAVSVAATRTVNGHALSADVVVTEADVKGLFYLREPITAGFTAVAADHSILKDVTSGTFTIALTAAATLANNWKMAVINSGSGVITINPDGAETIRDQNSSTATKTLSQGESAIIFCDGVGFLMMKFPNLSGIGTGDVVGPASSVSGRLAVFSGTTGKLLVDGGISIADLAAIYQALDGDLGVIAGLTATTDNFIQSKSGAWASRTVAQVLADLQGTGGAVDTAGFRGLPQNSQSTAYTLVLADSGKHVLHPSADTTARIFTIPANSSVAFPIGAAVTFVNQNGGGVITIAITTDTMRLAGAGTTGSRTLAANGIATALKVTSTEWLISGTGLT